MADLPYSRVYWTIVDDEKFATIYDSNDHLATWLRLLLIADQANPASAHVPVGTSSKSLNALVACGLVDLSGGRYRIHGLRAERDRRAERGRTAANARWNADASSGAMQDSAKSDARRDETSLDELRQDEPSNGRADALDAYWTLMGVYPNGRTKDWITELVHEFDDQRVSAALAAESKGDRQGILGRVRDRLRSEADKAAKTKDAAATAKLEAEATAKRITPSQAAENRRRVNAELAKMIGPKP